jgi:hypothetical protein
MYDPPSLIVDSDTYLTSKMINGAFGLAEACQITGTSTSTSPIGTAKYLVILYCPTMGLFVADDAQSPFNNKRCAGLVTFQTDSTSTEFEVENFAGIRDSIGRSGLAYPYENVFGYVPSTVDLLINNWS